MGVCAKSVARGSHCLVCVVGVDSRVCCAVSGASRRAGTPLGLFPGVCGVRVVVLLCLSVVLAAGSRPVPFRTRKLSLPAPMVLHPGGCGRVSYRRPKNTHKQLHNNAAPPHHSDGCRVTCIPSLTITSHPPHTTRENTKQIPQSSNQPEP